MAINKHELGFVVTGLAIAILLGYVATLQVDARVYPEIEFSLGGGLNSPMASEPREHLHAQNSLVPVNYTPHRYPTVAGGNITALIHRGWSPLRMKAPADSKWIESPPGEVMF